MQALRLEKKENEFNLNESLFIQEHILKKLKFFLNPILGRPWGVFRICNRPPPCFSDFLPTKHVCKPHFLEIFLCVLLQINCSFDYLGYKKSDLAGSGHQKVPVECLTKCSIKLQFLINLRSAQYTGVRGRWSNQSILLLNQYSFLDFFKIFYFPSK